MEKNLKRYKLIRKSDWSKSDHFYWSKSSKVSWRRYHIELDIKEWVGRIAKDRDRDTEGML